MSIVAPMRFETSPASRHDPSVHGSNTATREPALSGLNSLNGVNGLKEMPEALGRVPALPPGRSCEGYLLPGEVRYFLLSATKDTGGVEAIGMAMGWIELLLLDRSGTQVIASRSSALGEGGGFRQICHQSAASGEYLLALVNRSGRPLLFVLLAW